MANKQVEPSLFIIFGGTGDLSRRKLLPAIGRLAASLSLSDNLHVLGIARDTRQDDASFRDLAMESMIASGLRADEIAGFCNRRFHYQTIGNGAPSDYTQLRARLELLEQQHGLPANRTFYLAIPTASLGDTLSGLASAGMNQSSGWVRIVIEKPFGYDRASAGELVGLIRKYFAEDQVYRIDHYLGKETVQNLLVFRFGNPIFESLWNRDHIDSVQISVSEELGVGTRAGYYDKAGALRDMVQNHLTQLLTLLAMEVPPVIGADSVRYEKIKVLRSMAPILPGDVTFGQYSKGAIRGQPVPGYLEEIGVGASSTTETFAALKVEIMNWRWQGVPFYLRTGKRMPRQLTRIGVQFRNAPVCMFDVDGVCAVKPNTLLLTLQPDEGFSLHIGVKKPGSPSDVKQIPLSFKYRDIFDDIPEAYQTLVLDVLKGDQTLFVHSDEVLEAWNLYDPLLRWKYKVYPYAAGTRGPAEADRLAISEKELFENF
ncbi:MAG: glucose-6-phosphate dehydrogenase [Methylococcaceae bacterium]|nr:glucose-6-phosphate dehydrogenase [Methylococcaceae bacterium]